MTHEQFGILLKFLQAKKVCLMIEEDGEWKTWHHNLISEDMDEIIAQATDLDHFISGPLEQKGGVECP